MEARDVHRPDRFEALPARAAFLHEGVRQGFEVVFCAPAGGGHRIEGQVTALEAGEPWSVQYSIELDSACCTRHAVIIGRSEQGEAVLRVEQVGDGRWRVDGQAAPGLDGCSDVDLEASAFTNALPVRRLQLPVGGEVAAPAAWVRALSLRVERLEQRYRRLEGGPDGERYAYAAHGLGFQSELTFDRRGVVVAYPGIGRRVL